MLVGFQLKGQRIFLFLLQKVNMHRKHLLTWFNKDFSSQIIVKQKLAKELINCNF